MHQGGFEAVTPGLANVGATLDQQLKQKRWAAAHIIIAFCFFFFEIISIARKGNTHLFTAETGWLY